LNQPPHSITPLPTRSILVFWLPLAATWFMMAVEGPYLAAIVARLPDTAFNLAAYGVAFSFAWFVESPIMMLLTASNTLVRDRASFFALRRFTMGLNAFVTLIVATLAFPPVFSFIADQLIGLPPEVSRLAHVATAILIPWPAAIGYRRFYQGILVRHHLTRRVAYGTVVRLSTMSMTAAALALTTRLPGAWIGAAALSAGVVMEAAASRWMARHVVATILASDERAPGTLLSMREIAAFYYPLALTSVLSMALGPLVTFFLGRSRMPVESLAVWPVVNGLVFLFRSSGIGYQEVGVALMGLRYEHEPEVRRVAGLLGATASSALALMLLSPLAHIWFDRVAGLTPDLAELALGSTRLLFMLPALEFVLAFQRSRLILMHRTRMVTAATAVEVCGLAVTMIIAVGVFHQVGALAAALALIVGRVAANIFLMTPSLVALTAVTPARTESRAKEA
jgi:hypothetical protein